MKALHLLSVLLLAPVPLSAETAEIKMLIDEERRVEALGILGVKAEGEPETRVCFFDTPGAALDQHKLILRIRLDTKVGKSGKKNADSIVKLRGSETAPKGFEKLKAEADWVGPDAVNDVKPSLSIKTEGLNEELMRSVINGTAEPAKVMSGEQQKFAAACLGVPEDEFPWSKLKRYGAIDVWKSKRNIGLLKNVTVELWRLTRHGKEPLELLEISLKTKDGDAKPVLEVAKEFYEQAEKAGLGKAEGKSKTQKVLDYYKPGM